MKFKCGLTVEEREAETLEYYAALRDALVNGQKVFAWWPVKLAPGDCRWLEWVLRFPLVFTYSGRTREMLKKGSYPPVSDIGFWSSVYTAPLTYTTYKECKETK